jgi:hypothetical protein
MIGFMRPGPYEREIEMARAMRRGRRGDPRERRATAWSVLVIGSLIIVSSLPPLFAEIRSYRRQARVPGLPTATGTVLESRVQKEEDSVWKRAADLDIFPLIRYRYTVDGRAYESSRFAFQHFDLWRDECEAIVADHPPGSVVDVYYHADNPQLAAISPRPAQLNGIIVIFCGALLLAGAGAVAAGLRARPWQADPEADAARRDDPVSDLAGRSRN